MFTLCPKPEAVSAKGKQIAQGLVLLALSCANLLTGQYVIDTFAGGVPIPTPIAAGNASLSVLNGIATDRAGNLYFTAGAAVYRMDSLAIVTRIAGGGRPGFSGDGGLAINAQLSGPIGLAVSRAGDIYVGDGSRIRRISPAGVISTIAGKDVPGHTGDGGPAVNALIGGPFALALDKSGNLYFSDSNIAGVRKISTDGIITTVIGKGVAGFSGDGGPAAAALLDQPQGIALDDAGNLYIADTGNGRVRRVSPGGIITTVAGDGGCCTHVDGIPATQAHMSSITGVATDSAGALYIAQSSSVRKVQANGIITTIAGTGPAGFSGDGGPAVLAQLGELTIGLTFDPAGNLYIADGYYPRIRKVSPSGIITTAVGNGLFNMSGDGGPASVAQMGAPDSLAMDASGNLYVGDPTNYIVRKISPFGIVTRVAGTGVGGYSGDGGPAIQAQLRGAGIALGADGTLYIADIINNRVRKVTSDGIISTFAGNGTFGYSGDGGPAVAAQLQFPSVVAVDPAGNVYIADANRVRKVSRTGIISTVAGSANQGLAGDGGLATNAQLNNVNGIAFDPAGNVLLADTYNHRIRQVSPAGIITSVIGTDPPNGGIHDGPAKNAFLAGPAGMVFDKQGNLYISDRELRIILRVSPDGMSKVFAGETSFAYSGDGGPPTSASLKSPNGMAVDRDNNLFIADLFSGVIRVVKPWTLVGAVNAASNLPGPIAPGEIVVLTGTGLGPVQLAQASLNSKGSFDTQLAGMSVRFNDVPAPVIYTSAKQVAVVVPYSVSGPAVDVRLSYQGQTTSPLSLAFTASVPAIFTADSSGQGQAAALNQDGSFNGPAHPAKIGDILVFYVTGEGQTTPTGVDGKLSAAPYPIPNLPVMVSIGGQAVTPLYAGEAPGQIAGLMQVNVQIPYGIATGNTVPLFIRVGNASSPSGVVVAVQ